MSVVALSIASHPVVAHGTGRHRAAVTTRSGLTRTLDLVGHLGSLVTLAALLVLAGAVGGLVDGEPVSDGATLTATYGAAR